MRVFYLDTAPQELEHPLCACRLPYTGEEDQLLPISTVVKYNCKARKTFNVVSYRLLFDFVLLEMTDGSSESGYIAAFNRKRRTFFGDFGDSAKECSKKIWLLAVEDFEDAINADKREAFSCPKCPSENSPGDGQDEVHIGDGISEGTQVDLVPDHIKSSQESIPCKHSHLPINITYYNDFFQ